MVAIGGHFFVEYVGWGEARTPTLLVAVPFCWGSCLTPTYELS